MLQNKKCCIDSCVWIKYTGHFKTATLLKYISDNHLTVFADRYLLSEIHTALIKVFNFTVAEADYIIRNIEPFLILTTPRNVYRLSPDPHDNFLYDICIQNNANT